MNPDDLKARASEALAKGRFQKACEFYELYCAQVPRDLQSRLRMGDALAKAGFTAQAIAAYASVAEAFAREGFLPRAIAASKLILELDPGHQGVQQMLAGLYAKRGVPPPRASALPAPTTAGAGAQAEQEPPPLADEPAARWVSGSPPGVESLPEDLGEAVDVETEPREVPHVASGGLEDSLRALAVGGKRDAAPATTPRASASAFTELELGGDSLLQALELAAKIGRTPPAEAPAPAPPSSGPGHVALPTLPLFSDLSAEAFVELLERCPLRRVRKGERVIEQGAGGDSFFVICEGSVRVFRTEHGVERHLAQLRGGSFFGEMALLSGAPRTASVEGAEDDTQLLEISAAVLGPLTRRHASIATALRNFCRQRLLANLMDTSELFRPFSRADRRALVERFRAREVSAGDVLVHEGQRSDGLYVVLSGEVGVERGGSELARLKEGELFGEMSLLTKSSATASVRALRRTSLLRLPREDFNELILSHPQVLVLVSQLNDERRRQLESLPIEGSGQGEDEPLLMV